MATVLLVGFGSDGNSISDALEAEVSDIDVRTEAARNCPEALDDNDIGCVVIKAPGGPDDSLDFLDNVRSEFPNVSCVVFGRGSAEFARDVLSQDGVEYVPQTPSGDDIVVLADRVSTVLDEWGQLSSNHYRLPDDISESHLLNQLTEHIPTAVYVKDEEGRHLLLSDYEQSPDEALGKTDPEVYGEEFGRETFEDDMQVIEGGEPIVDKEEYNPDDNAWTLTSKFPWYDEEGDVRGLMGATRIITEKKEYEQMIERQNERLNRFVDIASHDLRNPLNVARGYLEIVSEETDHENLEDIEQALSHMETLIEHLLTLAQSGQDISSMDTTSLDSTFEEAWDTVQTEDAEYEVVDNIEFSADGRRVVQMFANLIRNSIEHAGDDVSIEVGQMDDGFYYEDDGPGVPEELRDDLFEQGVSSSEDGTGFGLFIVRDIADAHGWNVSVDDAESGGARFEVEFELKSVTEPSVESA